MCGQVRQRDRTAVSLRDRRPGREVLGDRIGKDDVSAFGHVGEEECREDLRHRPDLEGRIAVERTGGDDPVALRPADPDDDAYAVLGIGPAGEHLADLGVGGWRGGGGGCDGCCDQAEE